MLRGSLVAIVTPMTADGSLDWAAWDRLLDFHVREGTDGIVIAGTTGESPALSLEETEELTRRAVERCGGKVKLIVGAATNATASTVARTRTLSRLGVDGVMLVTPYYNKPPQEGLFRHFSAAADASEVPVVLYNVPNRTAVDLQPATVARLARHPRIVALKDASASLGRLRELLQRLSGRFLGTVGRRRHGHRMDGRGRAWRDFGHRQCGAEAHARGMRGGAGGRHGGRARASTPTCSPCTRIYSSKRTRSR